MKGFTIKNKKRAIDSNLNFIHSTKLFLDPIGTQHLFTSQNLRPLDKERSNKINKIKPSKYIRIVYKLRHITLI